MASKHIEKVAIIGATGNIGKAFAEALLKTGKHIVTALVRPDTNQAALPSGIKTTPVDYSSDQSIISALTGQQLLIITLSVRAPNDLHSRIVQAASKANVKWVLPNTWGSDKDNITLSKENLYGEQSLAKYRELESLGLSYVAFCCGFWYEWSLALPEPWYGFDVGKRQVTLFDDGKARISTSTWNQCGRAMAALLSLPVEGASPALKDWENKTLYVASFRASQRDMLDSLHRVLGTTDDDWTIKREPSGKRYQRGLKEIKEGVVTGFATAMYTRTFYPSGKGDSADGDFHHKGLANGALGLPEESLDEATQRVVDMVQSGWNPFGDSLREPPEWTKAKK